jgi:hypothetical protein
LFPIGLPDPEALSTLAAELIALRDVAASSFDLVVDLQLGADPGPWEAAGATWVLTGFDSQPREAEVRAAIDAGPHAE